jgi:Thioredoxin like C-terminal domain
VRFYHFGEGDYDKTEQAIRRLLAEHEASLPSRSRVEGGTDAGERTPESYLGYERLDRYAGSPIVADREHRYRLPSSLGQDELAYGGLWRIEDERIVAGRDARLRLRFQGRAVHLVLAGQGRVHVLVDGRERARVRVSGDRLYTLARLPDRKSHVLELRFSPGLAAYAFTFG